MSFSYEAILFALFSLIFAVVYGKKYYYFFFLLYCVSNLRAGSRGSFLCIFVAFMLIILVYGKKTNVKIGVLLGGGCGCVVLIFGNQIIDFLSMLIGHSRTLVLLKSGEIFSMSGRENFYNLMRKALFENLFLIKGFYADRVYLCNSFGKPFSPGTYAHNIIYEIVYDFGGVGIVFLLFLFYYTFKCYKIVKISGDNAVKNLYIVSVSYAFGQLFISSSFLIAPSFGILIATYLFICHYKRVTFE